MNKVQLFSFGVMSLENCLSSCADDTHTLTYFKRALLGPPILLLLFLNTHSFPADAGIIVWGPRSASNSTKFKTIFLGPRLTLDFEEDFELQRFRVWTTEVPSLNFKGKLFQWKSFTKTQPKKSDQQTPSANEKRVKTSIAGLIFIDFFRSFTTWSFKWVWSRFGFFLKCLKTILQHRRSGPALKVNHRKRRNVWWSLAFCRFVAQTAP